MVVQEDLFHNSPSSNSMVPYTIPNTNARGLGRIYERFSKMFHSVFDWIICCHRHRRFSRKTTISSRIKRQAGLGDRTLSDLEASRRIKEIEQYTVRSNNLSTKDSSSNNFVGEHVISHFLAWAFRSSFIQVIFVFLVMYGALVILFSALILLNGRLRPSCIGPDDILDDNYRSRMTFIDAFALSWTTFSTVGYGNIYPSLHSKCGIIAFLCSAEAFIGVLYAGFSGAIIFAKVIRIQARAAVVFTDALCIHYVKPNNRNQEVDESSTGDSLPTVSKSWSGEAENQDTMCKRINRDIDVRSLEETESKPKILREPELYHLTDSFCPILEFRVINTRANDLGGEILNAHLSAVVSLKVDKVPSSVTSPINHNIGNLNTRRLSKRYGFETFDEGTMVTLPKQTFRDIILETPDHPFFRRVWYGRHVLDSNSPLLRTKVTQMINDNNGIWPPQLRNATSIRSTLRKFNEIIVSLSGTSNDSADNVYARKLYTYGDICIGWQFADVAYYDDYYHKIHVDLNLMNDIVEQHGGGGEALNIIIDDKENDDDSENGEETA